MNLTLAEKAERWPLGFWSLVALLSSFVPSMLIELVKYQFDVPNIVILGTVAGSVMFAVVVMSPAYLARWFIRRLPNR